MLFFSFLCKYFAYTIRIYFHVLHIVISIHFSSDYSHVDRKLFLNPKDHCRGRSRIFRKWGLPYQMWFPVFEKGGG